MTYKCLNLFFSLSKCSTLFLCCLSFSFQSAIAATNVKHSHEGRTHSHLLPKTGVKHFHKHMHNGRAHIHPYSSKIGFKHTHNQSARAKAWANAVTHSHVNRKHTHPLPPSGIKHQHRHRHGGRSHIHPLPVSGTQHFHNINQFSAKQTAQKAKTVRRITGLSIKQQMAAVLGKPYSLAQPKSTVVNQNKSAIQSPKRKIPALNQATINKVLGLHFHNGRRHQHAMPIAGAKHTHRKAVKKVIAKTQSAPKRKLATNKSKSTNAKTIRIAKHQQKKHQTLQKSTQKKVPKKVVQKPIKIIPPVRRVKQTPQQVTESNRQFDLALRYEQGTGVTKNLPQAFNWYQRAAKNGHSRAQFHLAALYENGKGTARNMPQAIRWYTAAANNGDVNAQVDLGNRYAEGRNVPKSIQQAAKWYKRAADQGDVRGRANLNYLIEDYNGVIK